MIRKRGSNQWQIRVDLGRDPVTGKRVQAYHSFSGTKREAEGEERRLLRERDTGSYVLPDRTTVAEFLDWWLAQIEVRKTTHDRYRSICKLHLIPVLGRIRLSKLRPLQIQNLYTMKLAKGGRADGKEGLSTTSVLHIHRVLHEALNAAMRLQIIGMNPTNSAKPPRKRDNEMKVLTEVETKAMLDKAFGTALYYPILVAVTTGLRRGELLGLRWKDVDSEKGTLAVCRTLQRSSDGLTFHEPKTDASKRTIALMAITAKALKEHRAQQSEQRLSRGSEWIDQDLVFCNADGTPWNPGSFGSQYRVFARDAGFEVRFHDLRHTHATHMLRAGIHPKVASERLGHSKVGITLDLYSHVIEGMDRDAADTVGDLLAVAGIA